ncbi:MAG TPA: MarR family transcriptional regulator [Acidimicrobiales bacterium]|nr:MarR family transcriptional regulator [Acidimicrobiales bacterium]
MPPLPDTDGLLAELSEAFLEVTRVMAEIAARTLAAQEELTVLQYRALVVLAESGSSRVAALAEALHVSPSTATRLCDRLVAKQLIGRNRSVEDRREVQVALADNGRFLVEEVTRGRLGAIRAILAEIDEERYPALLEAIASFANASRELSPFGVPAGR